MSRIHPYYSVVHVGKYSPVLQNGVIDGLEGFMSVQILF